VRRNNIERCNQPVLPQLAQRTAAAKRPRSTYDSNPLHACELQDIAESYMDQPPLPFDEVRRIVQQLRPGDSLTVVWDRPATATCPVAVSHTLWTGTIVETHDCGARIAYNPMKTRTETATLPIPATGFRYFALQPCMAAIAPASQVADVARSPPVPR